MQTDKHKEVIDLIYKKMLKRELDILKKGLKAFRYFTGEKGEV